MEEIQEFEDLFDLPGNFTGKCKIKSGGRTIYLLNGKYHRLDGPAIENANGYKAWYKKGYPHRLDGPAVEYSGGTKHWYKEGERYSKEEFNDLPEVIMYKAGLGVFV
jgi:hypothetical protein